MISLYYCCQCSAHLRLRRGSWSIHRCTDVTFTVDWRPRSGSFIVNCTDHHRFSHDSITALLKLTTHGSNVLRWHDSELINREFSRDGISNRSWDHVCAGTMGPWSQWWGRMWAGQCLKHYYLYSPRRPRPFIHLQSVNPGQPNYQNDWG